MTKQHFRSLPLRESPARVDREQRVIYGVSAAQAVEALGHGIELDRRTIEQVVELGNKTKNGVGVKSRYTHPGLSSDGMGKQLGRMRNFRVEGDKAVGDLHLHESASHTPSGDLAGHVMGLADEDSEAFGMSIVAGGDLVWTLDNGTEIDAFEVEERPANALTKLPVFRVTELDAVDVVDEPAANRDGMFSRALWGTNVKAEQFFGDFDRVLAQMSMSPQQAWNYALRYFEARHVDMKGLTMSEEQQAVMEPTLVEEETVTTEEVIEERADAQEEEVTQEEFSKLQAQFESLAAEKLAAQERESKLAAQVEAMQREARQGRFEALAHGWQGEFAAHMTILEALGEGSEAFGVYRTLMAALSEQIVQGGLFEEKGSNPQSGAGDAYKRLETEANRIRSNNPSMTFEQAFDAAVQANPQLYREYREETE